MKKRKNYTLPVIGQELTIQGKAWKVLDNTGSIHIVSIYDGGGSHRMYPTLEDDAGKKYACINMLKAIAPPPINWPALLYKHMFFIAGLASAVAFSWLDNDRVVYLLVCLTCFVIDAIRDIANAIREGGKAE